MIQCSFTIAERLGIYEQPQVRVPLSEVNDRLWLHSNAVSWLRCLARKTPPGVTINIVGIY